jgi:hypothetical protein
LLVIIDILNKVIESDQEMKVFQEFLEKKNKKWRSKL